MDLDLEIRRVRRRDRERSAPKRQRRKTKRGGRLLLMAPSECDYKVDTDGEEEGNKAAPGGDANNEGELGRESQKNSKPRASSRPNASGSGEIEAAKRSLATAQKWAASTVDSLKTAEGRLKEAEKCVDDAKNQAKSAREQVEEAEAYLKTVEQKWEVIDVDEDSDDDLARATKRREQGKGTKTGEGARRDSKAGKRKNQVLTIDSSSDDESSVDAPFDASGRTRLPGDRASIDAVRIAIGKKVFKRGCELGLQLGTRNPYFLFSYLDGKGQKNEHTIHLKDDELKEMRYYIDDEEEFELDDAMNAILFRITPSVGNDFGRYPHCYDPDDDTTKTEKRYIAVEPRDGDELRAMLAQMQDHPDLELWCGAESKIPATDLANYTRAFVEDNQREKESRLCFGRRARSGGSSKASGNKLLLVYPFAVDGSTLTAAATGLAELGGDLLGAEGASQSGTGAADESGRAGGISERNGKSSRAHFITIRQDDKGRLSPGQFLNDSLVDFWMRWISRGEPSQPDSNVHFFTTHFMTTLKDDGPEAVASWTEKKNINIFEKKLIFVPVNADLHWSLCVVVNPGLVVNNFDDGISEDAEHAFLFFLDSRRKHSRKTYSKHIRKWLNCEWERLKKKKGGATLAPFDESAKRVPMRSPKIPYQESDGEAGVFVCRYAYALYTMRHQKFTWTDALERPSFKSLITNGPAFQFGMTDIARIRVEMAHLIDNLSKHYLQMKAANQAAKESDSTGQENMTDNLGRPMEE